MQKDWILIVNMIGLSLAIAGSLILTDFGHNLQQVHPVLTVSGAQG